MKKNFYLAFENSVMFQYFIKEISFTKFYMNPSNDNDITFLIHLLTEITLWYTIYVRYLC